MLSCICRQNADRSIGTGQTAGGGSRDCCCREWDERYHTSREARGRSRITGKGTGSGVSRMARVDGISCISCLQVLIWFWMTARGRGLGVEDDDMPTPQGTLTPRDVRLMVRITSAMKTAFLCIVTVSVN